MLQRRSVETARSGRLESCREERRSLRAKSRSPASNAGQIALATIAGLASVVGAYYYTRIVKVMYFDEAAAAFEGPFQSSLSIIVDDRQHADFGRSLDDVSGCGFCTICHCELAAPVIFATYAFDEIGSTNDEAASRARSGAPEGTCILAKVQTSGRGRQARHWHSSAGNLYCSLLLRPQTSVARFGEISFIAALAAGETVGHFGADWALKWPNDVLVNGKKISGLLLESEPGWLVVGIGINLAHAPDIPDKPTTCLAAEGPLITPEQARLVLQDRFKFYYDLWQAQGFAPIREQWLAHAANLGKPLIARLASTKEEQGVFETLDADGALLLRT